MWLIREKQQQPCYARLIRWAPVFSSWWRTLESLPNYVRYVFLAFHDEVIVWSQDLDHTIHPQLLIYLCSVTRLLVKHCPLLLTTLVVRLGKRGEIKTWIFPSPYSVDSSLVTSHDYNTFSCLIQDSTAWLWQNTSFEKGKSSCGKRWCVISEEELVYLAFLLRGAEKFT